MYSTEQAQFIIDIFNSEISPMTLIQYIIMKDHVMF